MAMLTAKVMVTVVSVAERKRDCVSEVFEWIFERLRKKKTFFSFSLFSLL